MDSTKERIIETTARLLWSQGLAGTGLNQIIAESGAPRGSVYFHFPGGKEQLATEALRAAGAVITANIREALEKRNTRVAIQKYVAAFTEELEASDYQRGCPIATVALEAAFASPALREVCSQIFADWQTLLADRLVEDDVPRKRATELAVFILSTIEGALILCRTRRSASPLRIAAKQMYAVLPE